MASKTSNLDSLNKGEKNIYLGSWLLDIYFLFVESSSHHFASYLFNKMVNNKF